MIFKMKHEYSFFKFQNVTELHYGSYGSGKIKLIKSLHGRMHKGRIEWEGHLVDANITRSI